MTEEMLFQQMNIIRKGTLHTASDVSEAQAAHIPPGFRNNICWHLGHILVIQEFLLFRLTGEALLLTEDYFRMFGRGTKPADWQAAPPSLDTLRALLNTQTTRIEETFRSRLGETARRPFVLREGVEMKTIGEILNFSLIHEGMHQGCISSMKLLVKEAGV